MNPTAALAAQQFQPQLLERRAKLQAASQTLSAPYLKDLIAEVDAALRRIEDGTYGLCEVCHDSIEAERLEHNPLMCWCLDHLSPAELKAHQLDMDLASQIQGGLLPPRLLALKQWQAHYRYAPLSAVGGDYCELIEFGGDELFFAVGDVAGKGVAASLLMTHLSAIFRSLLTLDLPLGEVVARANRLFCESTSPSHYATLACGRTTAQGVEICNAGHCPPLLLRRESTGKVDSTGLPLGLFCNAQFGVRCEALGAEESLVLYSDGITEAQNPAGQEFEEQRLIGALRQHLCADVEAMADRILSDHARFRGTQPAGDDMTLLIVQRRG